MPIYEYRCNECNNTFEKLVFGQDEVLCPNCGAGVERLMSSCNFKSAAGDFKSAASSGSSCTSCTASTCAGCH
jgi:putative FmdB family regulatory protein